MAPGQQAPESWRPRCPGTRTQGSMRRPGPSRRQVSPLWGGPTPWRLRRGRWQLRPRHRQHLRLRRPHGPQGVGRQPQPLMCTAAARPSVCPGRRGRLPPDASRCTCAWACAYVCVYASVCVCICVFCMGTLKNDLDFKRIHRKAQSQ